MVLKKNLFFFAYICAHVAPRPTRSGPKKCAFIIPSPLKTMSLKMNGNIDTHTLRSATGDWKHALNCVSIYIVFKINK